MNENPNFIGHFRANFLSGQETQGVVISGLMLSEGIKGMLAVGSQLKGTSGHLSHVKQPLYLHEARSSYSTRPKSMEPQPTQKT